MLQEPGCQALCCGISTYHEYDPNAWITLDLVMEDSNDQAGKARLR